ncbi:hypothetical protein PIROE2DRAFT_37669, partial [Piromyces sp. E2]
FVKKNDIKMNELEESFRVAGVGNGFIRIREQTEKCMLRCRNHLEVIQLYGLRVPGVDIILGLP